MNNVFDFLAPIAACILLGFLLFKWAIITNKAIDDIKY
jgi:predicted permease